MIAPLARWLARFQMTQRAKIDMAAARPIGPGLAVYVIDVDGRRIVLAASSHSMCVLARYLVPQFNTAEGQPSTTV